MLSPALQCPVVASIQRAGGFALAAGIDRIADMRTLYENDMRFLEQF